MIQSRQEWSISEFAWSSRASYAWQQHKKKRTAGKNQIVIIMMVANKSAIVLNIRLDFVAALAVLLVLGPVRKSVQLRAGAAFHTSILSGAKSSKDSPAVTYLKELIAKKNAKNCRWDMKQHENQQEAGAVMCSLGFPGAIETTQRPPRLCKILSTQPTAMSTRQALVRCRSLANDDTGGDKKFNYANVKCFVWMSLYLPLGYARIKWACWLIDGIVILANINIYPLESLTGLPFLSLTNPTVDFPIITFGQSHSIDLLFFVSSDPEDSATNNIQNWDNHVACNHEEICNYHLICTSQQHSYRPWRKSKLL